MTIPVEADNKGLDGTSRAGEGVVGIFAILLSGGSPLLWVPGLAMVIDAASGGHRIKGLARGWDKFMSGGNANNKDLDG